MDNEAKIICPECGSDDVLVGTDKLKNKCSACGHKWENDQEITETVTTGAIADFTRNTLPAMPQKKKKKKKVEEGIRLVEPETITFNQTPFNQSFEKKLSRVLGCLDEENRR